MFFIHSGWDFEAEFAMVAMIRSSSCLKRCSIEFIIRSSSWSSSVFVTYTGAVLEPAVGFNADEFGGFWTKSGGMNCAGGAVPLFNEYAELAIPKDIARDCISIVLIKSFAP